jgi:hypothetical protein
MMPTLLRWLRRLSHLLGFETAESFPAGHLYERTRWQGAYFDIASDVKPEQIEQRLCDAISNTPLVFGYITNPTPRMQRTLLSILEERMRNNRGRASNWLRCWCRPTIARTSWKCCPACVPPLRPPAMRT